MKERMLQADVQEVLAEGRQRPDGTLNPYLRKAADIIEADFTKTFTGPDPGESSDAFEERRKHSHQRGSTLRRREPETQEAWEKRRAGWRNVCLPRETAGAVAEYRAHRGFASSWANSKL